MLLFDDDNVNKLSYKALELLHQSYVHKITYIQQNLLDALLYVKSDFAQILQQTSSLQLYALLSSYHCLDLLDEEDRALLPVLCYNLQKIEQRLLHIISLN